MSSFSSWRHQSSSITGQDHPDDDVSITDPTSHRQRASSFSNASRNPAMRSFVSTHGKVGQQIDSTENARSVREDTAEIAAYFLNDRSQPLSTSFLARQRPSTPASSRISIEEERPRISSLHSHPHTSDGGSSSQWDSEHHEIDSEAALDALVEVEDGPSMIANALRRSPPEETLPCVAPEIKICRTASGLQAEEQTDENTALMAGMMRRGVTAEAGSSYGSAEEDDVSVDVEGQKYLRSSRFSWFKNTPVNLSLNPIKWNYSVLYSRAVLQPAHCLPAVVVGLLLNILDALSYGMILFPLANPIFSNLGSAGISIFYLSTIISQLTFTYGSIFKGGVGSELIEVVPFFHNMASSIVSIVGEENPDAVIATTITAYACSSIITGMVFYLMGKFKFGYMVGFIPRHILIGCIGGVGLFLILTGFEVSGRLEGGVQFDKDTLEQLIDPETMWQWVIPFVLAIALFAGHQMIKSRFFLPLYIMCIPFIFYFFVLTLDQLDVDTLRDAGWIFTGPPAGEPWWYFYTLYQFKLVHWGAVFECIPAMFALTFFGVLHVPINVPALAAHAGEDNVDLDAELKLHGISNMISGGCGSIQNYLVFANTVFFQRSGGDSRLAGYMLAAATAATMLIGPSLIGFIPVMMVGCLIFDLGFELLLEAVWVPRKKMTVFEYLTVVTIVLVMAVHDFVIGILVGVLLAFVHMIFQTAGVPAIRSIFSGAEVSSTVRRNPTHHHYLKVAGQQISIIKLSGFLFFGTIVSVEEKIRAIIDDTAFRERPIRYLICDLRQVTGLDYSAVEAFGTISRLLKAKDVELIVSGIDADSSLGRTLRACGLVGAEGYDGAALLPDLNSALESCENELLKIFFARHDAMSRLHEQQQQSTATALSVPASFKNANSEFRDMPANSPRQDLLQKAAHESLTASQDHVRPKRWKAFKEPLRLILGIFNGISERNEDFWFHATKYFTKREHVRGECLYQAGQPADGFYMVEKGMIRIEYDQPQGRYSECIVAGTTCGELPFFSETQRTASAVVEMDCTIWVLTAEMWEKMRKEEPMVAMELLTISLKLTSERMSSITAFTLMMAN